MLTSKQCVEKSEYTLIVLEKQIGTALHPLQAKQFPIKLKMDSSVEDLGMRYVSRKHY